MTQVEDQPKRRGRPRAPENKRRRHNLTLRIRTQLLAILEERAASNGRSLSEEAEAILESEYLRTTDLLPLENRSHPINDAVLSHLYKLQSWQEYTRIINTALGSTMELFVRCKNDDLYEPMLRLMSALRSHQMLEMQSYLEDEYYSVIFDNLMSSSIDKDLSEIMRGFSKEQIISEWKLQDKYKTAHLYESISLKSPTMTPSLKSKFDEANRKMRLEIAEAIKIAKPSPISEDHIQMLSDMNLIDGTGSDYVRKEHISQRFGNSTANLIFNIEKKTGKTISDDDILSSVKECLIQDTLIRLQNLERENPGHKATALLWSSLYHESQMALIYKYGSTVKDYHDDAMEEVGRRHLTRSVQA